MDKAKGKRKRATTVPPFIDKEFILIIFFYFLLKLSMKDELDSIMDKTPK